jgi:hypothetical protein
METAIRRLREHMPIECPPKQLTRAKSGQVSERGVSMKVRRKTIMLSDKEITNRLWMVYQLLADVGRMPEPEVDPEEFDRTIFDLRTLTLASLPPKE